jgi:hypothetical protein
VHLAMPNAKLGAKVDRYSFFVRLLPPLLHTGLARRTNIPISLKTLMSENEAPALLPGYSLISGSLQAKRPASTIIRR